ncbi:MAG: hypothetical protein ACP5HS_14675 [Anaerolineae bacterium]
MNGKYQDVEITVFPGPEQFRAANVEDEARVADTIREEVLPREKRDYHSVKVMVKRKPDGSPDYLVAYMLRKDTYTADVVRVDVNENFEATEFTDDYYEEVEEEEEEELEEGAREAPGEEYEAYDFVAATPVPEIPTAKQAAETIHELALAAGLNSKLLLGADASVANYIAYLSSGLRGFVNIGHGNTHEIVLADGRLSATHFQRIGRRLCPAVVYFNSCQVFNNPLQPAIMAAGARTFIGGIVNLLIGPSEAVCKCFWQRVLAQGAAMSVLADCEKANYPSVGSHGISGDLETINFLSSTIDAYKVVLYGKNRTPEHLVAFIHCYSKGINVASCEFYADENVMPDNRYGGCRVGLAYPWSRFSAVLDVLRNEKPVYYGFIFSTKVGYIATHAEPAGEGEA